MIVELKVWVSMLKSTEYDKKLVLVEFSTNKPATDAWNRH